MRCALEFFPFRGIKGFTFMKKFLPILSIAIAISLLPASAATPPKAGSICSKQGITKTYQGKKYTCIKSGTKLVWNKGVVVEKTIPTQTSKPSPTPIPVATQNVLAYENPSETSDNIESCRIKEVNINGPRNGSAGPGGAAIQLPSGFPGVIPAIKNTGTVKWALIPIDFPNLKGESNFKNRVSDQMKSLSDWYFTVSEGKFKIEWVVPDAWVTLPKNTSEYEINSSMNLTNSVIGQSLFTDAMNASDPKFDFTNIQQVNFILPKGQSFLQESAQGFPWDKAVRELKTNEGYVFGFTIPGKFFDQPGSAYWSYWAHEFGHSISLAHVGASRGEMPPFNPWDIMGGQDGPSKELSGWLRFLSGWMSDNQVYCKNNINSGEIRLSLIPLSNKDSGVKLAIFPLPSGNALLIESRRVTEFSCTTKTKRDGILAYIYDPKLSHNEDFLVPILPINKTIIAEPSECYGGKVYNGMTTKDVLFRTGDKASVEGLTIEVLASENLDKIVVRK